MSDAAPRAEAGREGRGDHHGPPEREAALERVRSVLVAAGATDEEVRRAVDDDVLDLLAVDRLVVPSERHFTPRQVSEQSGLPLETLKQMWRALGFLQPGDDDAVLTDMDVEAARSLQQLLALGVTDTDTALQLARVIGASMARIAEASLLRGAEILHAADDSVYAADLFTAVAEETVSPMGTVLEFAWRRHMQAVARRAALERRAGRGRATPILAVGFADMVGFTLLSQHLRADELAAVVRRFEEISYDTVIERGGRVVKTIGDEVMFVTADPVSAVRIGVTLAEAYADDELLSDVRVGLAMGPVLVRDGDYFGSTVNLASRIVRIAEPGSVLVSDELHHEVEKAGTDEFGAHPLRPRVLKDVGRAQLWSYQRAGAEGDGSHAARRRARWERFSRVLRDIDELRSLGERTLASGRIPTAKVAKAAKVGKVGKVVPKRQSAGS